jgi:hypothetical protein
MIIKSKYGNNIFGEYTSSYFTGKRSFFEDKDCFLFNLNTKKKYTPKNLQYSVLDEDMIFPSFGGENGTNYDLRIKVILIRRWIHYFFLLLGQLFFIWSNIEL